MNELRATANVKGLVNLFANGADYAIVRKMIGNTGYDADEIEDFEHDCKLIDSERVVESSAAGNMYESLSPSVRVYFERFMFGTRVKNICDSMRSKGHSDEEIASVRNAIDAYETRKNERETSGGAAAAVTVSQAPKPAGHQKPGQNLQTYVAMYNAGVPIESITNNMSIHGVDAAEIQAFTQSLVSSSETSHPPTAATLNENKPEETKPATVAAQLTGPQYATYYRMYKSGVILPGIHTTMRIKGHTQAEIDQFTASLGDAPSDSGDFLGSYLAASSAVGPAKPTASAPPPPPPTSAPVPPQPPRSQPAPASVVPMVGSAKTKENETYRKMYKSGVPIHGIINTMRVKGRTQADIDAFVEEIQNETAGGKPDAASSTHTPVVSPKTGAPSAPETAPLPPPPPSAPLPNSNSSDGAKVWEPHPASDIENLYLLLGKVTPALREPALLTLFADGFVAVDGPNTLGCNFLNSIAFYTRCWKSSSSPESALISGPHHEIFNRILGELSAAAYLAREIDLIRATSLDSAATSAIARGVSRALSTLPFSPSVTARHRFILPVDFRGEKGELRSCWTLTFEKDSPETFKLSVCTGGAAASHTYHPMQIVNNKIKIGPVVFEALSSGPVCSEIVLFLLLRCCATASPTNDPRVFYEVFLPAFCEGQCVDERRSTHIPYNTPLRSSAASHGRCVLATIKSAVALAGVPSQVSKLMMLTLRLEAMRAAADTLPDFPTRFDEVVFDEMIKNVSRSALKLLPTLPPTRAAEILSLINTTKEKSDGFPTGSFRSKIEGLGDAEIDVAHTPHLNFPSHLCGQPPPPENGTVPNASVFESVKFENLNSDSSRDIDKILAEVATVSENLEKLRKIVDEDGYAEGQRPYGCKSHVALLHLIAVVDRLAENLPVPNVGDSKCVWTQHRLDIELARKFLRQILRILTQYNAAVMSVPRTRSTETSRAIVCSVFFTIVDAILNADSLVDASPLTALLTKFKSRNLDMPRLCSNAINRLSFDACTSNLLLTASQIPLRAAVLRYFADTNAIASKSTDKFLEPLSASVSPPPLDPDPAPPLPASCLPPAPPQPNFSTSRKPLPPTKPSPPPTQTYSGLWDLGKITSVYTSPDESLLLAWELARVLNGEKEHLVLENLSNILEGSARAVVSGFETVPEFSYYRDAAVYFALSLSPVGGRQNAAGSTDGNFKIWSLADASPKWQVKMSSNKAEAVFYVSVFGSFVGDDPSVRVRRFESGAAAQRLLLGNAGMVADCDEEDVIYSQNMPLFDDTLSEEESEHFLCLLTVPHLRLPLLLSWLKEDRATFVFHPKLASVIESVMFEPGSYLFENKNIKSWSDGAMVPLPKSELGSISGLLLEDISSGASTVENFIQLFQSALALASHADFRSNSVDGVLLITSIALRLRQYLPDNHPSLPALRTSLHTDSAPILAAWLAAAKSQSNQTQRAALFACHLASLAAENILQGNSDVENIRDFLEHGASVVSWLTQLPSASPQERALVSREVPLSTFFATLRHISANVDNFLIGRDPVQRNEILSHVARVASNGTECGGAAAVEWVRDDSVAVWVDSSSRLRFSVHTCELTVLGTNFAPVPLPLKNHPDFTHVFGDASQMVCSHLPDRAGIQVWSGSRLHFIYFDADAAAGEEHSFKLYSPAAYENMSSQGDLRVELMGTFWKSISLPFSDLSPVPENERRIISDGIERVASGLQPVLFAIDDHTQSNPNVSTYLLRTLADVDSSEFLWFVIRCTSSYLEICVPVVVPPRPDIYFVAIFSSNSRRSLCEYELPVPEPLSAKPSPLIADLRHPPPSPLLTHALGVSSLSLSHTNAILKSILPRFRLDIFRQSHSGGVEKVIHQWELRAVLPDILLSTLNIWAPTGPPPKKTDKFIFFGERRRGGDKYSSVPREISVEVALAGLWSLAKVRCFSDTGENLILIDPTWSGDFDLVTRLWKNVGHFEGGSHTLLWGTRPNSHGRSRIHSLQFPRLHYSFIQRPADIRLALASEENIDQILYLNLNDEEARAVSRFPNLLPLKHTNGVVSVMIPNRRLVASVRTGLETISNFYYVSHTDESDAGAPHAKYYTYTVRPLVETVEPNSVASAVYLFVVSLAVRNFSHCMAIIDQCATDVPLAGEEAFFASQIGPLVTDTSPDAVACRLALCEALYSSNGEHPPWDFVSDISSYLSRVEKVSAECVLPPSVELWLLLQILETPRPALLPIRNASTMNDGQPAEIDFVRARVRIFEIANRHPALVTERHRKHVSESPTPTNKHAGGGWHRMQAHASDFLNNWDSATEDPFHAPPPSFKTAAGAPSVTPGGGRVSKNGESVVTLSEIDRLISTSIKSGPYASFCLLSEALRGNIIFDIGSGEGRRDDGVRWATIITSWTYFKLQKIQPTNFFPHVPLNILAVVSVVAKNYLTGTPHALTLQPFPPLPQLDVKQFAATRQLNLWSGQMMSAARRVATLEEYRAAVSPFFFPLPAPFVLSLGPLRADVFGEIEIGSGGGDAEHRKIHPFAFGPTELRKDKLETYASQPLGDVVGVWPGVGIERAEYDAEMTNLDLPFNLTNVYEARTGAGFAVIDRIKSDLQLAAVSAQNEVRASLRYIPTDAMRTSARSADGKPPPLQHTFAEMHHAAGAITHALNLERQFVANFSQHVLLSANHPGDGAASASVRYNLQRLAGLRGEIKLADLFRILLGENPEEHLTRANPHILLPKYIMDSAVVLLLGSTRLQQLHRALHSLRQIVTNLSAYLLSLLEASGYSPRVVNAVCHCDGTLSPDEMLAQLHIANQHCDSLSQKFGKSIEEARGAMLAGGGDVEIAADILSSGSLPAYVKNLAARNSWGTKSQDGRVADAVSEVENGVQIFLTEIQAQRSYMKSDLDGYTFNPRFLVFEFCTGYLLHSRQVELVTEFVSRAKRGLSSVNQMLMGSGKTTVISPLLFLALSNNALVTLVVPPALTNMSKSVLRSVLSSPILRRRVLQIDFGRYSLSGENATKVAEFLSEKLTLARLLRRAVVTVPQCVKSIFLKYLELGLDTPHGDHLPSTATTPPPADTLTNIFKEWQRGVLLMDEVDLILHPLRSELNFPVGAKTPLDFRDFRCSSAMRLVEALLPSQGSTERSLDRLAHSGLDLKTEIQHVISRGVEKRSLQRSPHVVMCDPAFYKNLKPLLCRWQLNWILSHLSDPDVYLKPVEVSPSLAWASSTKVGGVGGVSGRAGVYTPEGPLLSLDSAHSWVSGDNPGECEWGVTFDSPVEISAVTVTFSPISDFFCFSGLSMLPDRLDVCLHMGETLLVVARESEFRHKTIRFAGVRAEGLTLKMRGIAKWFSIERVTLHQTVAAEIDPNDTNVSEKMYAFLLDTFSSPAEKETVEQSVNGLPHTVVKLLNINRDLLRSYFPHALGKINRVGYGLLRDGEGLGQPISRQLCAVPFVGKDSPSDSSEFAHPDVIILLTLLAYSHEGLRVSDLRRVVKRLKADMKREEGPLRARGSYILFENWVSFAQARRSARGEAPVPILPLQLFEPEDENQLQNLLSLFATNRNVINHYLKSYVFPKCLEHRVCKLSATGEEIGGDLLFGTRIGFSGTPSALLPISLGACRYEEKSDAKIINILTSRRFVSAEVVRDWTVKSVLARVCALSTNALIDCGAIITGISNFQVAELLCDQLGPEIHGVCYFDENDTACVLERGGAVTTLRQSGIHPANRFTFYDQIHTTGIDVKQGVSASAAVTIGKDSNLRDYAQGCWRMRGIGKGQTIHLLIIEEVAALISGVANSGELQTDAVAWLMSNTLRSERVEADRLHALQLNSVFRDKSFEFLVADSEARLASASLRRRTPDAKLSAHARGGRYTSAEWLEICRRKFIEPLDFTVKAEAERELSFEETLGIEVEKNKMFVLEEKQRETIMQISVADKFTSSRAAPLPDKRSLAEKSADEKTAKMVVEDWRLSAEVTEEATQETHSAARLHPFATIFASKFRRSANKKTQAAAPVPAKISAAVSVVEGHQPPPAASSRELDLQVSNEKDHEQEQEQEQAPLITQKQGRAWSGSAQKDIPWPLASLLHPAADSPPFFYPLQQYLPPGCETSLTFSAAEGAAASLSLNHTPVVSGNEIRRLKNVTAILLWDSDVSGGVVPETGGVKAIAISLREAETLRWLLLHTSAEKTSGSFAVILSNGNLIAATPSFCQSCPLDPPPLALPLDPSVTAAIQGLRFFNNEGSFSENEVDILSKILIGVEPADRLSFYISVLRGRRRDRHSGGDSTPHSLHRLFSS